MKVNEAKLKLPSKASFHDPLFNMYIWRVLTFVTQLPTTSAPV